MDTKYSGEDIGFLFDLDGVLIDSESEYTRIWTEIDRQYPTGIPDFARCIKGMTLVEIIERFFPSEEYKNAVPELLYRLEGEMVYNWLPGAEELLDRLKYLNIPAVLVTSSNEVKMRHLREQIPDLESKFRYIVTGDLVKNSKPDPEGYLLAASLIERQPGRCVVFEDSLQGVKAGYAAGAKVVGVEGTLPVSTLSPFCNLIVSSLEGLTPEYFIRTLEL